jgi:pilus assembly protein CpaF
MEVMVTLGSSNMPIVAIRQQIAAAVDLVVQVTRMSDGSRRCRSLTEVTTMEGDQVMLQDLFVFEKRGVSAEGKVLGRFAATGIRPRFYEKIVAAGMRIEPEVFEEVVEIGE